MRNLDDTMRSYLESADDPNLTDVFILFFRDKNFSDDILDLVFNFDIIRLIVVGVSNKTIADHLNISVEDIQEICKRFYNGFSGWEEDLDYNPLFHDGLLEKDVQRVVDDFKIHRDIYEGVWE